MTPNSYTSPSQVFLSSTSFVYIYTQFFFDMCITGEDGWRDCWESYWFKPDVPSYAVWDIHNRHAIIFPEPVWHISWYYSRCSKTTLLLAYSYESLACSRSESPEWFPTGSTSRQFTTAFCIRPVEGNKMERTSSMQWVASLDHLQKRIRGGVSSSEALASGK